MGTAIGGSAVARATGWLSLPNSASAERPVAGVLALPGHGGTAEEVVFGVGGYNYGRSV